MDTGYGALGALVCLIVASVWLGTLAQRMVERGSFMQGYFLGNRGLGAWTLALTATVQSGGTFMGFPALVYFNGWTVALWIGSYMVVPITGFGILAKRFAQLSRKTGAITVPDLLRERFGDSRVGLVASLLILFSMTSMMVAQFKAGALIMKIAMPKAGSLALSEGAMGAVDGYYLVGLVVFTLTVVGYTVIGGFLAAVWTDLLQSLIMWIGVMILLPLTLWHAGGLPRASEALRAERAVKNPIAAQAAAREPTLEHLERLHHALNQYAASHQNRYPATLAELAPPNATWAIDPATGGELEYFPPHEDVGTDAMRTLLVLAPADKDGMQAALYTNGHRRVGRFSAPGALLTGPGPFNFLALGVAISFFFQWVYAGMGSPAGMVRIMASKDTTTIRRSITLLSAYNLCIYLPLIVICICGRTLLPDLSEPDEIIPRLTLLTTNDFPGGSLVAGLILAAPFGAVMATVSSYLVVIASGLVRDVYQRFLNPAATSHELRRLSYFGMVAVGLIGIAFNVRPVQFLQSIVVFSGTLGATAFVVPAFMIAYWRRANGVGAMAAMLGGFFTVLVLYVVGSIRAGQFSPLRPFDLDAILWGMAVSLLAGVGTTLLTPPPEAERVSRFFDAAPPA